MSHIPFDPDNLSTLVLCTLCARCQQAPATTRRTSGQWVCDAPLCRGVVTVNDIDFSSTLRYRVLLDGVKVPYCFIADEDAGLVQCLATDAQGRIVLDKYFRQELQRRYGVVQIIPYHLKSEAPHGKDGDKPLPPWHPGDLTIHAAESL